MDQKTAAPPGDLRGSDTAQAFPERGLVRGMENAIYHRTSPVSQSQLKAFRRSPFHFHARHVLPVPAVFADDGGTDAMFAGTLCHCATLEPAEFLRRYVVGPEVKSRALKAWKDFVEDNPDRIAITPRQYETAMAQARSVRALDEVAEILHGAEFEVSAFWKDEATGIRCRCRPDAVNMRFGTRRDPRAVILDLKTTADASLDAVQSSIERYGYHHQEDWYTQGFAKASGMPVAGFLFAFVEADFPFAARAVEIVEPVRQVAARENRETLDELARCIAADKWPGYPSGVSEAMLPRWSMVRHGI